MGQAAVDLPDTPDAPPTSAASTDELLAQMAGEEIDRLLAEADGQRAAPPALAPSAAQQSPSLSATSSSEQPPPSDASQIGGLLSGLADSGPDPVKQLVEASSSPTAEKATGPDPLDVLDDLNATAERGALNSSSGSKQYGVADVPVAVRMLSWINSPIQSCPDHVREAIGKIAILTTVNAASIFAYVLFFRHH